MEPPLRQNFQFNIFELRIRKKFLPYKAVNMLLEVLGQHIKTVKQILKQAEVYYFVEYHVRLLASRSF